MARCWKETTLMMLADLVPARSVFVRLAAACAVIVAASAAQAQEPIVTGGSDPQREGAAALRVREAIAYSHELPRGAPTQDYPLVAWCEALVNGHVAVGESLGAATALDLDIIRLGKLEAADFRGALDAARSRQTPAALSAAEAASAEATAKWTPILAQSDEEVRSQAFGLFFGLPGRCEHAARRIRENITTPPATPAEVGLEAGA